jgi:geranylgeranyl diphosphate synthase type II
METRMQVSARIEHALDAVLTPGEAAGHPPRLAAAMRHAVFPGGARIRPTLCLAATTIPRSPTRRRPPSS